MDLLKVYIALLALPAGLIASVANASPLRARQSVPILNSNSSVPIFYNFNQISQVQNKNFSIGAENYAAEFYDDDDPYRFLLDNFEHLEKHIFSKMENFSFEDMPWVIPQKDSESSNKDVAYEEDEYSMEGLLNRTKGINLPVINLGYARYRASKYVKHGHYFIFKNIRYAAPPVDALRFKNPEDPLSESGIQDGSRGYQCFQAKTWNYYLMPLIGSKAPQSEDCLFLDLYVPAEVFDQGDVQFGPRGPKESKSVHKIRVQDLPIMTFLHGGAFVAGSKNGMYSPHGMMKVADGRMIYVSFNYRLGAFGFLPGSIMKQRGTTNLGLKDQRKALDWIQKYIHLFGGNRNNVTIMGEGAGAASIYHHLTAPEPIQFSRAILQSAMFFPQYDSNLMESRFNDYLSYSGCSSSLVPMRCLQYISAEDLAKANRDYVYTSGLEHAQFGPYVDGNYVPDLPQFRIANGEYHRGVELMVSFSSNAGASIVNDHKVFPWNFDHSINRMFPNISRDIKGDIESLYPLNYNDPIGMVPTRLKGILGDWLMGCHHRFLQKAFPQTYVYENKQLMGYNSVDKVLTFWGAFPRLPSFFYHLTANEYNLLWLDTMSRFHQQYLVSFAVYGSPNSLSTSGVKFSSTDSGALKPVLTYSRKGITKSSMAAESPSRIKCRFWKSDIWTKPSNATSCPQFKIFNTIY
ncbi:Carboxylesterase family-domain-containing protein [Lipomyces oligophaga]|uniref:Carboxylesterase family-domain-containing protein n=1 Tax=Lipomyces oligophaga TaxID=45792 RepID=UPI0034CE9CD1